MLLDQTEQRGQAPFPTTIVIYTVLRNEMAPIRDRSSLLRNETNNPFSFFLHSIAGVEEREVLAVAPHRCEVTVMRVIGIAGLARMIDGSRVIPVPDVYYNSNRGSAGLAEVARPVRRLARHEWTAVLWNRADVDFGAG